VVVVVVVKRPEHQTQCKFSMRQRNLKLWCCISNFTAEIAAREDI
jgi:hypothetical protein